MELIVVLDRNHFSLRKVNAIVMQVNAIAILRKVV